MGKILFTDTNDVTIDGLPVLVADDDFLEYLQEEGYGSSIELDDLLHEWCVWESENTE